MNYVKYMNEYIIELFIELLILVHRLFYCQNHEWIKQIRNEKWMVEITKELMEKSQAIVNTYSYVIELTDTVLYSRGMKKGWIC